LRDDVYLEKLILGKIEFRHYINHKPGPKSKQVQSSYPMQVEVLHQKALEKGTIQRDIS
jgi:hypothetical protein